MTKTKATQMPMKTIKINETITMSLTDIFDVLLHVKKCLDLWQYQAEAIGDTAVAITHYYVDDYDSITGRSISNNDDHYDNGSPHSGYHLNTKRAKNPNYHPEYLVTFSVTEDKYEGDSVVSYLLPFSALDPEILPSLALARKQEIETYHNKEAQKQLDSRREQYERLRREFEPNDISST
jgi:hypothetical protein